MKMNRRGFTLIELLAVILLLGLIVGISSPVVVTLITSSREKSRELSFQNIKSSANLYAKENSDTVKWLSDENSLLEPNQYTCVSVNELIDKGYIKENTVKDYIDETVKITRNITTKSVIEEEIVSSDSCNTELELDVGNITVSNSNNNKSNLTITNTTCTKSGEEFDPNKINVQYKLSIPRTLYIDGDMKDNKFEKEFAGLDLNKEYTYYVKCIYVDSDNKSSAIEKKGKIYTGNFGKISIDVDDSSCTETKKLNLRNVSDGDTSTIYYKLGKKGEWFEYKNNEYLNKNTTVYAAHKVGEAYVNVVTKAITNIDNGHIRIVKHEASNIRKDSANIDYVVDKSSICSKNYSYELRYGTASGNYDKSVTDNTGNSFNLTGLSSGTRYYYKIIVTNIGTGESVESSEGSFRTHTIPVIKTWTNSSSENWTNKMVTVTIRVEDTTEVKKVEYSYNNKDWYSEGFDFVEKKGNEYVFDAYWSQEVDTTVYFKAVNADGEESSINNTKIKIDLTPPTYKVDLRQNGSVLATYSSSGSHKYDKQVNGAVNIVIYDAKDPKVKYPGENTERNGSGLKNEFSFFWNSPNLSSYPDEIVYVGNETRTLNNGSNTRTITSYGKRSLLISILDEAGNSSNYEIKIDMLNPAVNDNRYLCASKKLTVYYITNCTSSQSCNYTYLNGLNSSSVMNERSKLRGYVDSSCLSNKIVCTSGSGLNCRAGASSSTGIKTSIPYKTQLSVAETTTSGWSYSPLYGCYLYNNYLKDTCSSSSSGGSSSGGGSSSSGGSEMSTTTYKSCYCAWCNTSKGTWEVSNNGYKTQYACQMGCRGGTPGWGSSPAKPNWCRSKTAGGCFLAGTKVKTNDGYKDIDRIKEGDIVLTYNENAKKNEYQKVLKLLVHDKVSERLYNLSFDDKTELKVTEAHRFYIKRNNKLNWIAVRDLKLGDYVRYADGKYHKITSVSSKEIKETVYNLNVDKNHNYYVGEQQILVHNQKVAVIHTW